jgi:RNA polymerase sigma-70 factor (ECF subfamily)
MDTRRPDDDAADRPARANESDGAATLFERLYAEHVAFVFRTLRQLGVPESTLEDAVQNVFIVAHRKLGEFEGRASLRTWLFRIVRRVASDARRSMRRRGGTEPIDEAMVDDGARLPDGEAERNEAARRLAQILETLDDEKRAVFVLAEIESMSAPEIAEALGVNVNTVASRLRAARQAFERALERDRRRNG